MQSHKSPQTRCQAAMGQIDITPPNGIYHRMWGAAKHDRAAGVHKPLKATILWMLPRSGERSKSVVIVGLDHCILDEVDLEMGKHGVGQALDILPSHVMICLSHTHAAGLMSRSRSTCPGGDMIGPYLDALFFKLASLAESLRESPVNATVTYGIGHCKLAADRDYWDQAQSRFVCGFNPDGVADDQLVVARIQSETGVCLGTIVNYACHPTTLAWENQLISPDYVGAMRNVVESHTQAPCLFLQGASGDLGPTEGFVGDTEIADRNGRMLGFAALSALETLPPPGTNFVYSGSVVSGTHIGDWKHKPRSDSELRETEKWQLDSLTAELPYRHDLPRIDDVRHQLAQWQEREATAITANDDAHHAYCRAMVEQMQRQIWRLESLPQGLCFPMNIDFARWGESRWLFVPGEHYQVLQTSLRKRFPEMPWIMATICNGWQPGYVPPACKFGYGIYQESIAVVGAGSAEIVIESIARVARLGWLRIPN